MEQSTLIPAPSLFKTHKSAKSDFSLVHFRKASGDAILSVPGQIREIQYFPETKRTIIKFLKMNGYDESKREIENVSLEEHNTFCEQAREFIWSDTFVDSL